MASYQTVTGPCLRALLKDEQVALDRAAAQPVPADANACAIMTLVPISRDILGQLLESPAPTRHRKYAVQAMHRRDSIGSPWVCSERVLYALPTGGRPLRLGPLRIAPASALTE